MSDFFKRFVPSICRDAATAYSQVARHGADFNILLDADGDRHPTHWRIGFLSGVPSAIRAAESVRVLLDWSGARLCLGIPPGACSAWLSAVLPRMDIGFPSGWMLDAVVESMLADIAAMLASSIDGADFHVIAQGAEVAERAWPHQWAVTVQNVASRSAYVITLDTDDLGLALLADALSRWNPADNGIDLDKMMLPVRMSVGMTTVQATDVQQVQIGDVIILDQCLLGPAGALWLTTADGQGVRVRPTVPDIGPASAGEMHAAQMPGSADTASAISFVVIEGWSVPMSQTPFNDVAPDIGNVRVPAQAASSEWLDVDVISVRLTFDMGEKNVMLGELRQLQPGHIFQLSSAVGDGPVFIRANGSCVGAGELVDVDGRVGVRILRLQQAAP